MGWRRCNANQPETQKGKKLSPVNIHECIRTLKDDPELCAAAPKLNVFMPLVIHDFNVVTAGMTDAAAMACLRLLMASWTMNGTLPHDEAAQARIAGVSRKFWASIKDRALTGFQLVDDQWVHVGLVQRRLEAARKYASASRRGKAGVEAKKATRSGLTVIENPDFPQAKLQAKLEAKLTPELKQRAYVSVSASASPLSPIQGDDVRKALGADYEEGLS